MNAYESTLSAAEWSICKLLSVTFVDHVKYADIPTGPPPLRGRRMQRGMIKCRFFYKYIAVSIEFSFHPYNI